MITQGKNTSRIGGRKAGIGVRPQARYSKLRFIILEQLSVGQIVEPLAQSFTVLEGADDFSVDSSGNITFNVLPDYDTQRTYTATIRSNRNRIYYVTVYVTIFTPTSVLTGTENLYSDTYITAA